MTGRRHGSICAWLCATLLGVVLLCGTLHSAEARRRVPRDKKSYFKKADQIADIMGTWPIGFYVRMMLPIGLHQYTFAGDNRIEISGNPGFSAHFQLGVFFGPNIGIHGLYSYTLARNDKTTLRVEGGSREDESLITGHSFGAGIFIRPFYRPFAADPMKKYLGITGDPAPNGFESFLQGLYIMADGFITTSQIEIFRGAQSAATRFEMGWGWGALAGVGYEFYRGLFSIGLFARYSTSPSTVVDDFVQGSLSERKKVELPGVWTEVFVGVLFSIAMQFPERRMLRGFFR